MRHLGVPYASVSYEKQTSYAIKMCVSDLLPLHLLDKKSIEWQLYVKDAAYPFQKLSYFRCTLTYPHFLYVV